MIRYVQVLCLVAVLGAGCTAVSTQGGEPATSSTVARGKELDLSDRGLTSIPNDVFTRLDLERLDVSGNRLTGAPQSQIQNLKKLKYLDLSDNRLTGLPAELGQLSNLEILDVSNNQLTGLPMELGNLTQLRVLDLTGNAYSQQDLDQIAGKLTRTEIRK